MSEWISHYKKTIVSTIIVIAILFLAFCLIYGMINGSIQQFFSEFFEIISPIIIGFVIAYLSRSFVNTLEKKVFPWIKNVTLKRLIAIILTFTIAVFIIVLIMTILIPNLLTTLQSFWDTYIVDYESAANMFAVRVNLIMDQFSFLDTTQRINPEEFVEFIRSNFPWIENLSEGDFSIIFPEYILPEGEGNSASIDISKLLTSDNFLSILGYILSLGSSMINLLKDVLLGIFVAIYMLMSKEKFNAYFRRFLNGFLSPRQVRFTYRFGHLLDKSFGGFIEGQFLDACIVGVVTYILFNALEFANPLLLATIIAVTNIIPILGPFIGGVPAAFLVLLTQPEKVILFIILIFILQQIDGNVICPHILGDKINISSLATLIAIIVMGGLFGVFGMVIGVPVFAVIIQLINNATINALRRKGFETALKHYYVGDSARIAEKNRFINSPDFLTKVASTTKKLLTNKKIKTKNNKKEK